MGNRITSFRGNVVSSSLKVDMSQKNFFLSNSLSTRLDAMENSDLRSDK
jgi:hypothetical protein